jgi:hypothetical protein
MKCNPLTGITFLILCLSSAIADASLTSITVSPVNSSTPYSQVLQFTATGNYSDGTPAILSSGVTWHSSNVCSLADLNAYVPVAVNSLLLGNLSPLSPADKLIEARSEFSDLASLANIGGSVAISKMQDISNIFLTLSLQYYATSPSYFTDLSTVINALTAITTIDQRDISAATANACGLGSLRAYLSNLQLGPLGRLSPENELIFSRNLFDNIYNRAKLGDTEAYWQFNTVAQAFLSASNYYYGGGSSYLADFNTVQLAQNNISSLILPAASAAISSDSGFATGVALGTSIITASFGNISGSTTLTITTPSPYTNATCGIAVNQTFTTAPTTNLCGTGIATTVTGSGPWIWSCNSPNGGTSATCLANLQSVLMGDLNGDDNVSAVDALLALRIAVQLDPATSYAIIHGDMNGDGKISAVDALLVLRKAVGL